MDFFFNPQTIVIVGATPNPAKGGNAIIKNLENAFKGIVYPVNPKYSEIEGLTCYPFIHSLPTKPDLAIIFIGAEQTVTAVEECIKKGIPGVIIESGGFSEAGERGKELQEQLMSLARETGIRIWGPNCMGLVDAIRGHVFSFTDPLVLKHLLKGGPLSMVVQSGMLSAGFLVDLLSHEISGFSKICSIGNKTDVDESDLLQYLLQDTTTGAIAFYLESFRDLQRFVNIYQNHRPPKTVVVLKGGKSASGAQAALSHTASIAGNSRIAEDILKESGIIVARDFHQMIDLCRTLEMTSSFADKPHPNAAILTFSGASGIVASDFMSEAGINVPPLTGKTMDKMSSFFPPWMPPANPVDLWPAIEHHSGKNWDIYSMALETVLADPEIDACMIHTFIGFSRIQLDMDKIASLVKQWQKPVFIWAMGEKEKIISSRRDAWTKKIPFFHELQRSVECMSVALSHRRMPPIPSATISTRQTLSFHRPSLGEYSAGAILDEHDSKEILRKAGLPTVREIKTESMEEALSFAHKIGYPVVLKALIPEEIHKSEKGLIRLNLWTEQQLQEAFHDLRGKTSPDTPLLIQEQIQGTREIILGYLRDEQFGPCVMVGLGGIFTEILHDTVFHTAPLEHHQAIRMVERMKNKKILGDFRGLPAVNLEDIAHYLVTLGELGTHNPAIQEIDINPLILSATGPVIVDATVIIASQCLKVQI